ncbi:K+-transporting ATPase ATPase C chain [Paenibacillus shirakamiensis]|uniref:Potassium-transporting ATPase KdpC subunit n=1 Tax=Paenibacillus shirakamiensis TaxID=1265935 RepID=A0ABS4JN11_9BACL|nr:potassium-transporting ATPase subunit KdpC [Paenibacillus shirakamiensis]MBP2002406.1 K+-transporting ATPase ATPase C chain [Paenibacillus shirakamiensis]
MKMILIPLRASLVLLLLCGVVYPLVTTGIAQVVFPYQANGSLMTQGNTIQGSMLIAQSVDSPKLFHPRASNAKYDPTASAGSNQAVASDTYLADQKVKVEEWRKANPALQTVPADLVTGSGSGLDPDLSPNGALAQIPGISKATGIPEATLTSLVQSTTKGRSLGVFGEPHVNVNELNRSILKLIQ